MGLEDEVQGEASMVNSEELYWLIEALPDTQLPRIKSLLDPLVHHNQRPSPSYWRWGIQAIR